MALKHGKLSDARARFGESLSIHHRSGCRRLVAEQLENLAAVALTESDATRATQLLGAGATVRENIGAPQPPRVHGEQERRLCQARTQLGEPAFVAAWQTGRAMTLTQAVAVALQLPAS